MLSCFIIVASIFLINLFTPSEKASDVGFTSEPVSFENISFELIGSNYVGDKHTFHLKVKNIGSNPVNPRSNFTITNGEKRFSSDDESYSASELNPGIEGTIDVTFIMKLEDLTSGEPKFLIDRGIVFKDIKEIKLKK